MLGNFGRLIVTFPSYGVILLTLYNFIAEPTPVDLVQGHRHIGQAAIFSSSGHYHQLTANYLITNYFFFIMTK